MMMKFLQPLRLACLVAVSILVVSCCGSADYRNALPADAVMTLSANSASLRQKSNMGDIEQNPLFMRIKSEFEKTDELSAEQKAYFISLFKNPVESGIDENKDFFVFTIMKGENPYSLEVSGGILLPIGDKVKFDRFIANIHDVSGTATEKSDGLSIIRIAQQMDMATMCVYNDVACMLYYSRNPYDQSLAEVKKLFAQKRSESLMGNKAVADQFSGKNDMNMVMSYGSMPSMANNPVLASMPMMGPLMNATMLGSMNFEKGKIVFDASIAYKNKEDEEKMMELYAFLQPQKGSLLQYIPAYSLGFMGWRMNGDSFYDMMAAMPVYSMMLSNPMAKQVVTAFEGDFIVSFSGMNSPNYPVASLLVEVKDPAILDVFLAQMSSMPVQKLGDGEYKMDIMGITILFGVKNGILYCTTEEVVKSALYGTAVESMDSMSSIVKGKTASFYMDFKGLGDLAGKMAGPSLNDPKTQVALSVLGIFDNMEAYGSMQEGKVIVNMVDTDRNALETICKKFDELIRQYLPQDTM